MSNKYIQHAESHFEGGMRKRTMKGQIKFVLFYLFFSFLEENKTSALQLYTVGMVFKGQKALKSSLDSVCQRATTGNIGPPVESSCLSARSLIPWLLTGPVMQTFLHRSFLKFSLSWTDSNSFCSTNKLREILEIYVTVLSAIHQCF